jgi:hypothetical protein
MPTPQIEVIMDSEDNEMLFVNRKRVLTYERKLGHQLRDPEVAEVAIRFIMAIRDTGNADAMKPAPTYKPWTGKDCPLRPGDLLLRRYCSFHAKVVFVMLRDDRIEVETICGIDNPKLLRLNGDQLAADYTFNNLPCGSKETTASDSSMEVVPISPQVQAQVAKILKDRGFEV